MSLKKEIEFTDTELKEALANYFKIESKDIYFYYIRNFSGNNHCIKYYVRSK